MGFVGQAFSQGPVVMSYLFHGIWVFSWKTHRLELCWRIHFQDGLITWLVPLHRGITIGLLECPLDMALASFRASDSRVIQEVMAFMI